MICYNCDKEFDNKPISRVCCSIRCAAALRKREWRKRKGLSHGKLDKDLVRDRYSRTYGITIAEYDRMFLQQNGLCKICQSPSSRKLAVDHCHESGKIRGLLCHNCNVGLGHFKDSPALLMAALTYIVDQDAHLGSDRFAGHAG